MSITSVSAPKQIAIDDSGKRFIRQSGPPGPGGAIGPAGPDGNVQVLADYAALRSLSAGSYAHALVRGSGSGVGDTLGNFAYDASDTTSADNGGTTIVDAAARRWKRMYEGDVLVRWFGAVGDGAADDTAAVQAAVNAGIAQRKRIVFDQPAHKLSGELDVVGDNVHLFTACKTRLFIDPLTSSRPYLLAVGNQTLYTSLTVHALPQTDVARVANVSAISTAEVATTTAAHGYANGTLVTFAGTNSTPALAGPYVIDAVTSTTFHIQGVDVTVAGTAAGTVAPTITVPVGSRSVTLNTVGDASNYAAGDWAWIRADNVTTSGGSGQPIAELMQVESANAGTGVVTFTAPTTKRYVAGGTYAFGLAKATAYVHSNILIEGLWLDNTRHRGLQVFNVVNLEVRNCKFTGVSAFSGRGRNFHIHHNEYEITTNAVIPVTVRGYFVAVDTGHSGLHFHDNICVGHGNNWCHINEGQSHVRIHDNTFRLPTSDPNGGVGSGYTDAVWPVIGIGHISWDVHVVRNRFVNSPTLVQDSGTTVRSDVIATTLGSGPYNQVGDHFGVLIEGNRIEGTIAGEGIDIASTSPVRVVANSMDIVSSGGFPISVAASNIGCVFIGNRVVVLTGTSQINTLNNNNTWIGNVFGSTDPLVTGQQAITLSTAARLTSGHSYVGNIAQSAWTFTGTGVKSSQNTGIPNVPRTILVGAGQMTALGSATFNSAAANGISGIVKLGDTGNETADCYVELDTWPAGYAITLWYCSDAAGAGNTYSLTTFVDPLVSGGTFTSTRISANPQSINETAAAVPTSTRVDQGTPYVSASAGPYHIRMTRTVADSATTALDLIALELVPQ
jgi:hypothetical protein